ncbi:MAG: DNA polymerase IV [Gammaproteobacteria bacterium]|nr:DNA polymerase IV [Gammaproteobacteria bacterium]
MHADAAPPARKIVHVDMDAFYASVEQRDRPELRGRPVVVAWLGRRSVVCAASYEARRFGIHSAMPALRAERLCPQAVFVKPDFARYRAVSRRVREIFLRHTPLVEPLSLDEAYLDVTVNRTGLATATEVARTVRAQIRAETGLTASAGVAANKFLAKIASDWRKPDGLFVIRPQDAEAFLAPLPVVRLPGVGRATEAVLRGLGIGTVAELRGVERAVLERHFGRFGTRLHDLARGIDHRPVDPEQPVRSISAEETFERDLPLAGLVPAVQQAAQRVWQSLRKTERVPRTVVLKLKTSDFRIITRSHTPAEAIASYEQLRRIAVALLDRVDLTPATRYRLAGVGLSNFRDPDADDAVQPVLFDDPDSDQVAVRA